MSRHGAQAIALALLTGTPAVAQLTFNDCHLVSVLAGLTLLLLATLGSLGKMTW